jgi:hypothetical protein
MRVSCAPVSPHDLRDCVKVFSSLCGESSMFFRDAFCDRKDLVASPKSASELDQYDRFGVRAARRCIASHATQALLDSLLTTCTVMYSLLHLTPATVGPVPRRLFEEVVFLRVLGNRPTAIRSSLWTLCQCPRLTRSTNNTPFLSLFCNAHVREFSHTDPSLRSIPCCATAFIATTGRP